MNYFLTDHLGSVRVIVDGNGTVKERNDYYAFGARHVRSDYLRLAGNRYKYNGKEEQVTGDLGYLDYGWRMHDSGLGRWFGMDPLSEEYLSFSPYNYCLSNPVNLIDPTGAWVSGPNGSITTNDPDEIYNFWSGLQHEFGSRDNWSGFGDWAWDFAMADTWGDPMYQSDGTLFRALSEVSVIRSKSRWNVTLASMQRWCFEIGSIMGWENYFGSVEASGYLYSNRSPLSLADQQVLFNRGVIGRQAFLEHPVTQIVGGAVSSLIPMGTVGNFGKLFEHGKGVSKYSKLLKAAQNRYPMKAGKIEKHHITPRYMGGPKNGPLVPLDAAYHQMITNEFRLRWGYGKGFQNTQELQKIMKKVYKKYPLPPGYRY